MSDVYDIKRIDPGAPPPGFADDVGDAHFVPAPCQVASRGLVLSSSPSASKVSP